MPSILNATTTSGLVTSADNSGSLQLQTNNGTTAVTIDTSQKVLVGTTTASSAGSIQMVLSNSVGAGIQFNNSTGVNGGAINSVGGNGLVFYGYSGAMGSESYSERMRITSAGDLLVNRTTAIASEQLGIGYDGAAKQGMYITDSSSATTVTMIGFYKAGSARGSITSTSTATAYNTSSDYRLKENVAPMTGALATVAQLKPVTYTWKADGSDGQGFIAHELQAVLPDAVTGEKDAVDAEGKPVYQGVDTSFLVATLTAAIQEQQAQIEELKAKVSALEGAK